MPNTGFVKISRKLAESDLMRNPVSLSVFLFILLRANYRDGEYNGVPILRGEAVITYPLLATACGITISQARTAIKNLILTGRIAVKKYPKFSVVSVIKYNAFQNIAGKTAGKSQANRRQVDSQIAPSEEIKNSKNKEYICSGSNYIAKSHTETGDGGRDDKSAALNADEEEAKLSAFGKSRAVMLSENQVGVLLDKLTLDEFNYYIDKLDDFITRKKATVANHYQTILRWVAEDRKL